MPRRHDWNYIRHRYITGEVTLQALANEPGAPHLTTIKKRASAEGWSEQREEHRDRTATKARDLAVISEADVAARHARMARALQAKALTRLQNMNPEELTPHAVLAYLKEATDIERRALGLDQRDDQGESELDRIARALANPRPVN